jgi:hypothetical protein
MFALCLRLVAAVICGYWAAGDTALGVASVFALIICRLPVVARSRSLKKCAWAIDSVPAGGNPSRRHFKNPLNPLRKHPDSRR